MEIGKSYPCLLCLSPDTTMQLKLDKKNRPYLSCFACGTMIFPRSSAALRGPTFLWGPLSLKIKEGDVAVSQALVDKAVERVQNGQQ